MALVTVFRSRLRPGADESYRPVATRMETLARSMDGFLEMSSSVADDGERVTIVWFADRRSQDAWATHPEHRAAQQLGRDEFYEWYEITVAEQISRHSFGSTPL